MDSCKGILEKDIKLLIVKVKDFVKVYWIFLVKWGFFLNLIVVCWKLIYVFKFWI